ncbi:MAG: MoaD/ThiS family protein [Pseudomonadota bacterium]
MKVRLKLYATLGQFLPAGARRNEIELDVPNDTSVLDLLMRHNVPMDSCHLILVNGVFSPPAAAGSAGLKEGDAVAVWPPVAGG